MYTHKLTSERIFDLRNISEMSRIRNTKATHSVRMSPLGKMSLESFRTLVNVVAADLAVVTYV